MRIIYLGSPSFAVPPLEALVNAGYEVVAVVTQPDRPAGRKRVLTPPPVKQAALDLGLPVVQPAKLRGSDVVQQLADLAPDAGIVAAYGEILRKRVLNIPPLGYLNIHPSLLPLHRGPTPVTGAILAGETETGVTIMQLDAGMDSGPVLAQQTVPLPPDARSGPLTDELFQLGAKMLPDVLHQYAAGQITPRAQAHDRATFTRMLKKEDGAIDWSQSATFIERQTRAYDPWPGTFTHWNGQQLKVRSAQVHPDTASQAATPGTIIATRDEGPLVATGRGGLELCEVQPAGKRLMSGQDWLRGQHEVIGKAFSDTPS
jgi:methionyl-tRNA formyltransferase